MTEREYKLKIHNLEREIEDLKVVINTAQTALRSTETILKSDEKKYNEVFTPSAKWVLNFKL
jgi:hypothetical protein